MKNKLYIFGAALLISMSAACKGRSAQPASDDTVAKRDAVRDSLSVDTNLGPDSLNKTVKKPAPVKK